MKYFKISTLIVLFAILSACNGNKKENNATTSEVSDSNIDKILPIFMKNEDNTILYKEASIDSKIVSNLSKEDNLSLIGLTSVKDAENGIWYKCYYPKEQIEGWTRQVSHWNFGANGRHLPFLQNLTLAIQQLGANPIEAKRLLGEPQSELAETGPMETSGYVDEDYIVTTTNMVYDGIRLIYEDERMIHANITKPGKRFGWITIGDKKCNKDFIMKKFKLTEDNFYDRMIWLNQ